MQGKLWMMALCVAMACTAAGEPAVAAGCGPIKSETGVLELADARKAASEVWKRAASLGNKAAFKAEMDARLGSQELAEGNAGDGVTEKEYVEIATSMFKGTDADNEGSIDCSELGSDTGQALARLLQ
jgi:hypothetical protein